MVVRYQLSGNSSCNDLYYIGYVSNARSIVTHSELNEKHLANCTL